MTSPKLMAALARALGGDEIAAKEFDTGMLHGWTDAYHGRGDLSRENGADMFATSAYREGYTRAYPKGATRRTEKLAREGKL